MSGGRWERGGSDDVGDDVEVEWVTDLVVVSTLLRYIQITLAQDGTFHTHPQIEQYNREN